MTDRIDPAADVEDLELDEGRLLPRWLFVFLGLAVGLAVGMGYSWGLNPVRYYNTDPVDLRRQHKETWILLVAATYRMDGDLDRALSRLGGLQDPEIGRTVAALTERYIQAGKPATRIRALASLADALGARSEAMMIYLATPEPTMFFTPTPQSPTPTVTAAPTDTPTSTPTPTDTPTSTPTPTDTPTPAPTLHPTVTRPSTATSIPPYYVERRQRLCDGDQDPPRIEIVVQSREGAGVPGREIWVTWSGGADRFLTGLKPELGLGYADFDMKRDAVYAVAVGDPTAPLLTNLKAEVCLPGEEDSPLASWRLTVVANDVAFTPTPTPTPSPVAPPTRTPAPTSTPSPTKTATPTSTPRPSATRTRAATRTPAASPSATATATRTPRSTRVPTATATWTPRPSPSATATRTPTRTRTPTPSATATPTPSPSPASTATSLAVGSPSPTARRTLVPTRAAIVP